MTGRPINESRQLAIITGAKTYEGAEHKCGTTERYVKGSGCVHCARQLQTEQREARLALMNGQAPGVNAATPSRLTTAAPAATAKESFPQPWD